MPLPAIWGPKLWAILHKIGEGAGQTLAKFAADERREVLWLVHHLEKVVPCVECRQHIEHYRKSHKPPDDPRDLRRWIWEFHEAVNKRLGKPPGPSLSQLQGQGQGQGQAQGQGLSQKSGICKTEILELWRVYEACVYESVLKGHLIGNDLREWKRHLYLWSAF